MNVNDFDTYLRRFDYEERTAMKIQLQELLELYLKGKVQIIDIRFKEEYEAWSVNFVKNIPLNFKSENIFSLYQSHAPYIEPSGRYFYNFWTDGGVFFRIKLVTLTLNKSIYTGGIPIQGNYYPRVNTSCEEDASIASVDGLPKLFPDRFKHIFRDLKMIKRERLENAINTNGYDK